MALMIGPIFSEIGNLNRLARFGNAGYRQFQAASHQRSAPPLLGIGCRQFTVERSVAEGISITEPHRAVTGLAKFRRVL